MQTHCGLQLVALFFNLDCRAFLTDAGVYYFETMQWS